MATKKNSAGKKAAADKKARIRWPFPRATLEEALKIPYAIKEHNGGNPWESDEVRKAIGAGIGGNAYFYLSAASRDYGLTIGTSAAEKIALAELGRDLVYAPNPDAEKVLKVRAFLGVDIFKSQGCSTLSTAVPLGQCIESGESSGVSLLVERCGLIAA